ncbi:NusG domain II-containing protein [Fusobacterium sp. PH5-44]|uniref:NusG domain II-containing protein n=1 Tax=unclassified Fusobacterium TaxID=2648384 RepID=UPI003D22279F
MSKYKTEKKYFRRWDIFIYLIFFLTFSIMGTLFLNKGKETASKIEIYIDSKLQYVYELQEAEKNFFVDTEIGGVNVQLKDFKVRVMTSNSPLQLCVKQGWIEKPGDMIIGVPDKLLIKIVGENNDGSSGLDDVDFIIR